MTGRTLATGLIAAAAAAGATAAGAALARSAGVALEVDGEAIPVSGVAVVTAACSLLGVLLAVALQRWSTRPARRFVVTTLSLTTVSLVPPVLVETGADTAATLVGLHLLAAAVVIPPLARALPAVRSRPCRPAARSLPGTG